MVAWEKQIEERSVPAWRDKYVAYGRLKRKLEQIKRIKQLEAVGSSNNDDVTRAAMTDSEWDRRISWTAERPSAENGASNPFLQEEAMQQRQEEFMQVVDHELVRVGEWYKDKVTALEARVRQLVASEESEGAQLSGSPHAEEVSALHLEAVRLTEFVLLNVEALRKIVKKMDKQCGTSCQKGFVEHSLKQSPLATRSSSEPFNGERARACRRALEQLVSPERLQELRSLAMESGGVGLSKKPWSLRRTLFSAAVGLLVFVVSAQFMVPLERARRCFGLMMFTVVMWVSEAAPFEATAMLVAPLATALDVMEGSKEQQAKKLLASVFNESLFLVLSGFTMSSIFSKCQLDCRAAWFLQRSLGDKPFLFMLAVMWLGVWLSALLSNVTAPLLLVEVLKPLLRDMPTDSRYSRALLLGLAFSCNVGGMMTPISSPQNVASLQALRQQGKDISWAEWLMLSIPFCTLAVFVSWLLILLVYQFDLSESEASRLQAPGKLVSKIPPVVFEQEELSRGKMVGLFGALATLGVFAYAPAAEAFGGTSSVALLFVALSLGLGGISRQTFNSYNWHLLFLIGGGSALGLAVQESGLLDLVTDAIKEHLSSSPWLLIAELMLVIVGATTFVSHTVAALVLMPLVVELGKEAGVDRLAVLLGAFACSTACALPMTSFPNVNSLMAVDDLGKPWLTVKNFLEDAEADYTSFEKLPNGDLLVEGLTFQHFNKARFRTPRRSEILQSRLKDLEEVKSWYAIVSKGSNVFMHPKSFPASFCRVAAAFKKGTILTKLVIGSILDFVDFFEFNRERKPGLPFWERSIDIFGRPQSNVFFQMQKLLSSFENELAERDPSSLPTTPFQAEVKEPKANNTCWAVEPKAAGGEGGDGEDEVPEAECDEY
ncbi:unnamed protein product [Durusdinium trenchii]|uniref:SPX domain-containing protein n=1 Tax=Durusdinium trenchii TaxID=1381693 RepID=A0ABP0HQS1_9DINO